MRGKKKKITKEMIRQYWKYNINPITGCRKETVSNSVEDFEVKVPIKYKNLGL